ncbi:MAG TPA: aldehyde ferredoxin oxidoreductase family protein [Syntrophomonadaceae bacterium]|nr:aldehyde ferredoxin oxidoreductase family protein [Syntrophomonadaceae bacterium]
MKGYAGRLLRVDLSSGTITKEKIPDEYLRDYIGGTGLAARYLYDEIPVNGDVFDENNKLFFSVGPLNGKQFPTSGRCNVSCRSPLTGIWLDSSWSGRFGYNLKRAGYDAIIIEGKSPRPVYLYINNEQVELKDASAVWGKMTSESLKGIYEECGISRASCCTIGPAGEKMVKTGCIIGDTTKAAGRGGSGALMGSKKLKAIYVYGSQNPEVPDEDVWRKVVKEINTKIKENKTSQGLKAYGTGVAMAMADQTGDAPIKNWTLGKWDGFAKVNGIAMAKTILKKHKPQCFACPIRCARYVEIDEGEYQMKGEGPEYEAMAALGSMCLNDNLESVAYANFLCNEYGIDVISTGSAISFAMEAYEKGILAKKDTDGIELTWGNVEAILAMIRKIANREGIGDLLGQGVREAADVLGQGTEDFAIHVKGLELPMHDPRAFFAFGPTYATSPRGGCHLRGYVGGFDGVGVMPEAGLNEPQDPHASEGKGFLAKIVQDYCAVFQSSVICFFTLYAVTPTDLAKALTAATGISYDAQKVLKAGERIFNLQRAFNNRLGLTSADDVLPERLLTSTIGGPNEGILPNFEEQMKEYYELRKWEDDGRPSKEKLRELGLDFVISDLYG